MTVGRSDLLVGDWWRYSVSLLGALLLVVGLGSVLLDGQITGDELLQVSGLVVLCLFLVGLGARIAVDVSAGHELGRVIGWTSFGIIVMAGLGGWTAFVFQQTVETAFEMALVFLSVLAAGALFGTIVGYYEVRLRALVERASRGAARREFLDEQQETLSSLNRIFRHQILNDLSVISGRSELLAAEKIRPEKATESISAHSVHMEETVARLEAIIDVLTHVRTRTEIPVSEAIDDARQQARERYPDLTLELDGVDEETTVRADELLSRALAELFTNATEHGGGPVRITLRDTSDSVVIAVSDEGPGIDVTPVESVFDPNTRGPDSDGDGLGLFLADLIIDRYDGEIRIPRADGGTTVEIVIPAE